MKQYKTVINSGLFCEIIVIMVELIVLMLGDGLLFAADQPQWGQRHTRNMISAETDLPDRFDPSSGENIKWIAELGTKTYATPVVADGKVYICTNNGKPKDKRHKGDRGVLLCLDEADGSVCWQLIVPKIKEDPFKDWPGVGMVSSAIVEDGYVYIVSNRGEVVCLDPDGLADGNDGPYKNEAEHMVPEGETPMELGDLDADIVWLFDVPAEVGVYPHDSAHCSILSHGDFLYVNTSSGLNSEHNAVRSPEAPCLIVLDRKTGKWLARDDEHIGPNIFHAAWSSPCLGTVNGKEQIIYGGADGIVYAFEPLASLPEKGTVVNLKKVWQFDCDPTAPKENVHQYIRNRNESPSIIEGLPVFYKGRIYVTGGGDIWWGKKSSWLTCIDATLTGDVTAKGEVWSYAMDDHCVATPSIYEGLVFATDCRGRIHCLDAEQGTLCWQHQAKREFWGSTLVADGKVYAGSLGRDVSILKADKKKELLSTVILDSDVIGTPVAANKTVFIATMRKLYAVSGKSK